MLFDFGAYSSLLLPFVIPGLVFAIVLASRGILYRQLPDALMAGLILVFTLRVSSWMLGFAGWYDSHDGYSTFMFYFPFNHWLLLGPLVWFYFLSLTNGRFRFSKSDSWHFLPEVLFLLLKAWIFVKDILIDHRMLGKPLEFHFGTKGELANSGLTNLWVLLEILTYASLLFYFIRTTLAYRKYRQYLKKEFSNTEFIRFNWLGAFVLVVAVGVVVSFLFDLISLVLPDGLSYIEYWYAYLIWGFIIYYLSIYGLQVRNEKRLQLQFEPEEASPALEKEAPTLKQDTLLKYMQEARPYLDPELTLHSLARQMGINPVQLSNTINKDLGQTFKEFINHYRVHAVKKRLQDPASSQYSLLALAMDCGFNSKATFNRVFKQLSGQTPSEFLRSKKNKSQNPVLRLVTPTLRRWRLLFLTVLQGHLLKTVKLH